MPRLVRNTLALLAGVVIGGAVNMLLVTLSPVLIPLPAGVDLSDPESLSRSVDLLQPRHYVMPFIAHAAGTFVGALVAYLIAATQKVPLALAIGIIFLAGGIAASFMIPAPLWFIALDLIVAYVPMAWLAVRVGGRRSSTSGPVNLTPRGQP